MDINTKIKSSIKDMSFIIKKTYRVALALSVVSNCLLKDDPFYLSLRKSSQELIKHTSTFSKKNLVQKEIIFSSVEEILLSTQKELFALASSGDITEKNFTVIDSAIGYILEEINSSEMPYREDRMSISSSVGVGRALVDREWLAAGQKEFTQTVPSAQKDMSFKEEKNTAKKPQKTEPKRHVKNEKSERINKILSFIKDKGEVSVKDIISVVSGVANKTIQRDLQELIDRGYVRKSGKRRWARYHYTK